MGKREKKFDAYINNAAPFAKPILTSIRDQVHAACPEVEEVMKWSFPHFVYAGGILCSMAAFNQHCTFGFWKGALIADAVTEKSADAHGQFGRMTSVKDLPTEKVMANFIKQAMQLNESGVRAPKKRDAKKKTAAPKQRVSVALNKPLR